MKSEKYKTGEKIRREVMGDEFVDRALAGTSDFDAPLQDMLFESAWGSSWGRDVHLTRRERSLITIAFLTALRASDELKGHVRGGLRNGCTKEEIREVILHATTYCGYPAAVSAFKAAKPVIEKFED